MPEQDTGAQDYLSGLRRNAEAASTDPAIDQTTLPLNEQVGLPFIQIAGPGDHLARLRQTAVASLADTTAKYSVTPPTQLEEGAWTLLNQLASGADATPSITDSITRDVRLMAATPEVAYILSHPDIVDEWQTAWWTNVMTSLGVTAGQDLTPAARGRLTSHDMTAKFFKKYEDKFSNVEREFLINTLASLPDAQEIMEAEGFKLHRSAGGFFNDQWSKLRNSAEMITKAPQAIRPLVNDPRGQMVFLMDEWLKNHSLDSVEDKSNFMVFVSQRAQGHIGDAAAMSSGPFRLIQQTVGWIPDVTLNKLNDTLVQAANPIGYETRQYGSIGQNVALAWGVDPSEGHYNTVSGSWDAFSQVFLDPQNIVFNFAGALKTAAKLPRVVSRAEALKYVMHPLGATKLGLKGWDASITARFTYAIFSKTADELPRTAKGIEAATWIAGTGNAAKIMRRYPTIPARMAERMAAEDTLSGVQELMAAGLQGAQALGDDAPLLTSRLAAELDFAETRYAETRGVYFDRGNADLNSLNPGRDLFSVTEDVLTVKAGDEKVARAVFGRAEKLRESTTGWQKGIILGDGEKLSVWNTPARSADTKPGFQVRNANDEIVAAFDGGADGNFAVISNYRGRGLGTAVAQIADKSVKGGLAPQSMTGAARAALGGPQVFETGALVGDGARKSVFVFSGGAPQVVDLGAEATRHTFLRGLTELAGNWELAAYLEDGGSLAALSRKDLAILVSYADGNGLAMLRQGDEVVVTGRGQKFLVNGVDGGADSVKFVDDAASDIETLAKARADRLAINDGMRTRQWVIKDLPTRGMFAELKGLIDGKGHILPKRFLEGLRRTGFQVAHKLPSNISLVEAGRGSKELSDWIRALGGGVEMADKWAEKFAKAEMGARKGIIQSALKDVGTKIENPLLRYGLIDFGEKQGHYTYFFDRAGRELGMGGDDSITAMTLAHLTESFAMPQAKELISSVRRFRGTQKRLPRITGGLIKGTQDERGFIAANLKSKMRKLHGQDAVDGLTHEDFLAMAYADVLGEGHRATGLGHVNNIRRMASKPIRMLHHTFVIAQLAFRAIPWASRVLIEETIRADLMGMPSLWKNPVDFIGNFMDARAIRKLPDRLKQQAAVIDSLMSDLFVKGGGVNAARIDAKLPGMLSDAAREGVNINDVSEVRAYMGHRLGKALLGGDVGSAGQLGLKGNGTRRVLLRERKIRDTYTTLDDKGLMKNFRWNIDGEEIAMRSFFSDWVTEVGAATMPMQWKANSMSPQVLKDYGRGYGRQIFQHLHNDEIIREFGYARYIDAANGTPTAYTAQKLVENRSWRRIQPNVEKKWIADGKAPASDLEMADDYLENIVDEIMFTLIDPLARHDVSDKVRIAEGLRTGRVEVTMNDTVHILDSSPDNYEGFVDTMGRLVTSAYNENVLMPHTVSAYFDPRYGQRAKDPNMVRRFTDWTMQVMGERTTQALSRQPAYLATHKKWNAHYLSLGWDAEDAKAMAHEQAVELVNYVFFNNSDIPQFLHDFNKVVPFFSAMVEVGSTWFYKIPSQNILPVGYFHLGRRVDRVVSGMINSGLVGYDPESNRMTLRVDSQMENAKDPITSVLGKGMFQIMRGPLTAAEHLVGLGRALAEPFDFDGVAIDGYNPADFSAWTKDGFELTIGNPIDISSTGIMAVNQFSMGATPALQWPISVGANAVFAADEQLEDVYQETLGEYAIAHPESDINLLLHHNRQLFIDANNKEEYDRAMFDVGFEIEDLKMPAYLALPHTSVWETVVDRMFFPFGKTENLGQAITSVSPAALNYVWRGMMVKFGDDGQSSITGWWLGQMSNYQVSSELIFQLQALEKDQGLLSQSLALAQEIEEMTEGTIIEIAKDPNGAGTVLNPEAKGAEAVQEKLDELEYLNVHIIKTMNDNAAGSLIFRGMVGEMLPATPRMWDRQQESAATYWATRDVAQDAKVRGSVNFANLLNTRPINSASDLNEIGGLVSAWMNDPSGDRAKVWALENNPAMLPFIQGKTYWGPGGPPPEAEGFDQWVDDLENKDRKAFKPEVWIYRQMATAAAIDREVDILNAYGQDPDVAVVEILRSYEAYRQVVEPHNKKIAALDFIDEQVFNGEYAAWQTREGLDSLSQYKMVTDRLRNTREEAENLIDLLEYTELSPDEERKVRGYLRSAIREIESAVLDLRGQAANNEAYMNPLEQNLASYFLEVATPYWDGRNEIFNTLDGVTNSIDRSMIFDTVRMYDNDHFAGRHEIRSTTSGERVRVPNEMVRAWNGKPQEERQERILRLVGKKPEWLNLFETNILAQEDKNMFLSLPTTLKQVEIYDQATIQKQGIKLYALENPQDMSGSERDKLIGQVDDSLETWLLDNGRGQEVTYRQALPIERLQMAGLLPLAMEGMMPYVNQVLEQLKAADKSPTSEAGRVAFLSLVEWLEDRYYVLHPQAGQDLDMLGLVIYDESIRSATYQRLLRGSLFGHLE